MLNLLCEYILLTYETIH